MTEVANAPLDVQNVEEDPSLIAEAAPATVNGDVSPAPPGTAGTEGDHDSGVDENTQAINENAPAKKTSAAKDGKSATRRITTRSTSRSKSFTREEEPKEVVKKVPMNKIEVGKGPSPNLKSVKSKIGSMENTHYKPGGGNVRIEHKKVEIGEVKPKVGAKNEAYQPSVGGQKKQFVTTQKLNWSAKSKVGSLENANYKPKGGDKKIETVKLNFKDKAQSKVASTVNIKHKPGGGDVKQTSAKTPDKPDDDLEEEKVEETPEPALQANGNTADHV